MASFADLRDQILVSVDARVGADEVRFLLADGRVFVMLHRQDCCETVSLVDVCGDVADLREAQVLDAREEINADDSNSCESGTWTFYVLQTTKGAVTLRWLGMSNGYYSEGVSFDEGTPSPQEVAQLRARHLNDTTVAASGARRKTMRL